MSSAIVFKDVATNLQKSITGLQGNLWIKDAFYWMHEGDIFGWKACPRSLLEELRNMYAQSTLLDIPHPALDPYPVSWKQFKSVFESDLQNLNELLSATPGGELQACAIRSEDISDSFDWVPDD